MVCQRRRGLHGERCAWTGRPAVRPSPGPASGARRSCCSAMPGRTRGLSMSSTRRHILPPPAWTRAREQRRARVPKMAARRWDWARIVLARSSSNGSPRSQTLQGCHEHGRSSDTAGRDGCSESARHVKRWADAGEIDAFAHRRSPQVPAPGRDRVLQKRQYQAAGPPDAAVPQGATELVKRPCAPSRKPRCARRVRPLVDSSRVAPARAFAGGAVRRGRRPGTPPHRPRSGRRRSSRWPRARGRAGGDRRRRPIPAARERLESRSGRIGARPSWRPWPGSCTTSRPAWRPHDALLGPWAPCDKCEVGRQAARRGGPRRDHLAPLSARITRRAGAAMRARCRAAPRPRRHDGRAPIRPDRLSGRSASGWDRATASITPGGHVLLGHRELRRAHCLADAVECRAATSSNSSASECPRRRNPATCPTRAGAVAAAARLPRRCAGPLHRARSPLAARRSGGARRPDTAVSARTRSRPGAGTCGTAGVCEALDLTASAQPLDGCLADSEQVATCRVDRTSVFMQP